MHKRIALVGVVILLSGLLVGLSGTGLRADEPVQPLAPQSRSGSTILEKQEAPKPESFLEALAGKLGITVDRLEQALKETKKELIEEWVDKQAQKLKEQVDQWAKELKERLTRVEPYQLLLQKLIRKQVHLKARVQWLPDYMPPYYWPYPYCVCYCYPNYYMPVRPWPWFQLPLPEPEVEPEIEEMPWLWFRFPWPWFQLPLPEVDLDPQPRGK